MSQQELREPSFLILASLAGGRKHGYSIIKETAELSGGRVTMKVGTLYAALDRLAAEGLIVHAGDEAVDGRLRRYFELSEEGVTVLNDEIVRLEHNAQAARRNLALRPVAERVAWA